MVDTDHEVKLMLHTAHIPELEVIEALAGDAIQASLTELRRQDDLTMALKAALRAGIDINTLSATSGLPISAIRKRVVSELSFGDDLRTLTGAC
jgi:hypothetical protein